MDLKTQIGQHIIKGDLKKAIDLLKEENINSENYQNQILLLYQRLQKNKKGQSLGILTAEEFKVERSKLSLKILSFAGNTSLSLQEKSSHNTSFFSKLFSRFSLGIKKPKTIFSESHFWEKEIDKIRHALKKRYEKRLILKTENRLPIDLNLTYTKEGTSEDYLHFDKDITVSGKIENGLTATLKKRNQILIIGAPGAGKTTQLLDLSIEWLKENKQKEIPFIFNLAQWKLKDVHFDEWLQSTLVSDYGFSIALAQEAIEKQVVLPLLDGLDEVGKDKKTRDEQNNHRNQCLSAISNYVALFNPKYLVICSRKKEYITTINAPVKATVIINPLTPEAIEKTLQNALTKQLETKDETTATTILDLLEKHPTIENVLCTPFYYNIALEVFDNRTISHDLPDKEESLEQYLVEQFVDKKLGRNKYVEKVYSANNLKHYFSWVAFMLNQENRVNFELITFQPRHLKKKQKISTITFLLFFICFGPIFYSVAAGFSGLVLTYMFASLVGWWFVSTDIAPKEISRLKILDLLKVSTWKKSITFRSQSFFQGLFFFILYIPLYALLFLETQSVEAIISGLLITVFVIWVVNLISTLVEDYAFTTIKRPYQRFVNEVLFSFIQWLIVVPLIIITIIYLLGEITTVENLFLQLGLLLYVGFLIAILDTSFLRQITLVIALQWEKKLPIAWVHFFTYGVGTRILEQDGGQWRFRHQILQDYFDKLYQEENIGSY